MIAKETTVSAALSVDPRVRSIIKAYGLKFVGTGVTPLDSLEKVGQANGLDDEKIGKMLGEMNALGKEEDGSVELTEKAAAELGKKIEEKGKKGIRLRLVSDGCGLYVYDMDFGTRSFENEKKIISHEVEIYVDKKSLSMLNGTVIDFIESKQGFVFNNPNVKE